MIEKRKLEHINIALNKDVSYHSVSSGFEDILIFPSVPDFDFNEIDTSVSFLGKKLNSPIMIDAITGGCDEAGRINKKLAQAAEKEGIAFALGSQRAMIEDRNLSKTYKVRDVAPTIPILGNIGIANLNKGMISRLDWALKEVDADALQIHINPIQEAVQKEGNKNFSGKIDMINHVCDNVDVPVIIKEVGHGFSADSLKRLSKTKARMINIAGAGGTSWAKIDSMRDGLSSAFNEDGVPTVLSFLLASKLTRKELIISGGVRNGIDVGKGLVMGAEIAAAAHPFLLAYKENRIEREIRKWKDELKIFMFTRNAKDVKALRKTDFKVVGKTKSIIDAFY